MSLSERERMEIADIVLKVLDAKLDQMRKEIIAGFVECIDWNNENFARIMEATNQSTVAELMKHRREVIEVRSSQAAEKSARLGFKPSATSSVA